jgi:hypothetical protein
MSTAIVQHKPLAPLDLQQTKQTMDLYQKGIHALLDDTDWQKFKSRDGTEQAFVKRSGWRKIATWFELSLETREITIDRDKNGNPDRARVIARAIAPNGRYAEGEGGCSIRERGFSKPEHDLPATASTRAINRAISNLVGLGAISAEEIEAADSTEPSAKDHPFGRLADEHWLKEAHEAARRILPNEPDEFIRLLSNSFDEGLPECAARTLKGVVFWLDREPPIADADAIDSTPEPSEE